MLGQTLHGIIKPNESSLIFLSGSKSAARFACEVDLNNEIG